MELILQKILKKVGIECGTSGNRLEFRAEVLGVNKNGTHRYNPHQLAFYRTAVITAIEYAILQAHVLQIAYPCASQEVSLGLFTK
ncbi:hypothetical protein [Propionivibrio sp.]|uniref:hypothetical protein n=1 Tax=Propionivibrio sp. TaxID=2212460 RepID=UPI003BF28523